MKKDKFATIEETAEAISSCFTPEQLKKLEISNDDKTFSFKEQLIAEFENHFSNYNVQQLEVFKAQKIKIQIEIFWINKKYNAFGCFFSKTNPRKKIYEQTSYKTTTTLSLIAAIASCFSAAWLIVKDIVKWII